MHQSAPLVVADGLVKIYKVADLEVFALQGLELEIPAGEMLALVGASGSGKSTLLNVLGGLDTPTAGTLRVGNVNLLDLREHELVNYKRKMVGFVWQQKARNLLPYLSALENVELPMTLAGVRGRARRGRALDLLDAVGLADRVKHRPELLSGGEQQRAAIAVALANEPRLLLADEPTGEVDSAAADTIFGVLRDLNQRMGVTVIVVTHDVQVAKRVDRVVAIRDGRTSTEIRRRRDVAGHVIREEEFALLDRVGRLQLPQHFMEALELKDRVRLDLESDHVSVWSDRAEDERRPLPDAQASVNAAPVADVTVGDEDDTRWLPPERR
ncbi:MAG: ABC transporter ATP-binding protein [Herpetosiphonaceae bacterium]|nr:ABC transporter ATP-binding protein [Herpetosiphonaceae bacterium]